MSDKNYAIVIDNGSSSIKAGIAGEEAPRSHFPSIVGIPKINDIMIGLHPSVIIVI
jgi:actin